MKGKFVITAETIRQWDMDDIEEKLRAVCSQLRDSTGWDVRVESVEYQKATFEELLADIVKGASRPEEQDGLGRAVDIEQLRVMYKDLRAEYEKGEVDEEIVDETISTALDRGLDVTDWCSHQKRRVMQGGAEVDIEPGRVQTPSGLRCDCCGKVIAV